MKFFWNIRRGSRVQSIRILGTARLSLSAEERKVMVINESGYIWICQWPSSLMRGSAAVSFLGLRVRIPLAAWKPVSSRCCVLSGRGQCDGPIPRPEEAYRLWFVIVCYLETLRLSLPWPTLGCCASLCSIYRISWWLHLKTKDSKVIKQL
jgi:hypothetical protein